MINRQTDRRTDRQTDILDVGEGLGKLCKRVVDGQKACVRAFPAAHHHTIIPSSDARFVGQQDPERRAAKAARVGAEARG